MDFVVRSGDDVAARCRPGERDVRGAGEERVRRAGADDAAGMSDAASEPIGAGDGLKRAVTGSRYVVYLVAAPTGTD